MQALFYIGLFGSFFFVVSSITVGVSLSTMQEMVDRRASVERMFRDIDFAINEILLRENVSLTPLLQQQNPVGGVQQREGPDVLYTAGNLSWTPEQLQVDPWQSDTRVVHIREEQVIDGDGVLADVDFYILASPGNDREMDTDLSEINTASDWRSFRATGAEGDDIVHTFSTKDALTGIWNQAATVENQVAETARRAYQRSVEAYSSRGAGGDSPIGILTSCVLFDAATREDMEFDSTLDCDDFNPDLVDECFQVSQYQRDLADWRALPPAERGPQPTPPGTEILPSANTPATECWKYEAGFYLPPDDPGHNADLYDDEYPAMAGSLALYHDPDTADIIDELGLAPALGNDPFLNPANPSGNITFRTRDGAPHVLILERGAFADVPGWRFDDRQTVITP
mgnify:CR=1 FL=1